MFIVWLIKEVDMGKYTKVEDLSHKRVKEFLFYYWGNII